MAGRERIAVAANDSLEQVLDQLRSSRAEEFVLDVDERSPLLLSVPNLDSLEETAQRQGIRLTIASNSSKVLNAARVFGLAVIDTTNIPAPTRRLDPNARLLAGEPLGGGDLSAPGGVAVADDAPAEPPPPRRIAPVVAFTTSNVAQDIDADPAPLEEGWSDDEPAPQPARGRARRDASPPTRRMRGPRLDPYGQPYPEDQGDEVATPEADAPRRGAPNARRAPQVAAPAPADTREEEGWDDDALVADLRDEDDQEGPRPGLLGGLRAFWADVRARVAAPRRAADQQDETDEADEAETLPDDDGWDEPPYRQRMARSAPAVASQPSTDDAVANDEVTDDTGELPAPLPARAPRTIRPLGTEYFESDRQPTARLRPISAPHDVADDDEVYEDEDEYVVRRGASHGLGWALIGLLAVALIGLLVAYVLVPRATVTLSARTGTPEIAFNVVVGEIDPTSPQGQSTNERIVIPAKRIIVPVSASASKPASGARFEPDITAGGPVILTNTATEAIAVPKGTVLTATDGRGYVTLEAITVGPADPFTSASLGTALINVAAETRGSAGNAPVGLVRGRLASGIFYNNRDAPIAGGSDRRVSTVTQQDLAAAQAAAEQEARAKWQAALTAAIPAGGQAMHDTAGLGAFRVEFSAKAGSDGSSVLATVTADATMLVYTASEIDARAKAEAQTRINAVAKAGEALVPGSVQLGTPQLVADVPGTLTYRMTATARSRAAIGGDAERAQLARDLAHQNDEEARATIARLAGVSAATIDYQTGIFPQRMPWLASHITVQVAER